jgi:putative DNA methylase
VIERRFDIPFVAQMALREKQIQQSYRPIIAVHKWFARRPGTLFRALVLAEFGKAPLKDAFYRAHSLAGIRIADPFMGGGTPLIEANRLGCDILGYDINPMACWIVEQELGTLDVRLYRREADALRARLSDEIGALYETTCQLCGSSAPAKYFIWVKRHTCERCDRPFDLFPGYVLSHNRRHPNHVIICSQCGNLNPVVDLDAPGQCGRCGCALVVQGPAGQGQCPCPHCGQDNSYPNPQTGAPKHRLVAIEYHCPLCKPGHQGRFFKEPDAQDRAKVADAAERLAAMELDFVPDDLIPSGDETNRLHRWGYRIYREMFNERQLLGLELSCRLISAVQPERVRNALATNLSDMLRYQNMLCRYDSVALKSLDIFSVHGFPVGLIQCESNLLGIPLGRTSNVGSGGWSNIVAKYARAKEYCDHPFEYRYQEGKKTKVRIEGEWIGDYGRDLFTASARQVELHCENSAKAKIPERSLDAVFTDPPYGGSVQYAELMDFCYVWLRKLVQAGHEQIFSAPSTRNQQELTVNETMDRDMTSFADGLSAVFTNMTRALKVGGPLVFTYHHRDQEGYVPVAVALLDAGLVCTACLPCPAEMGASIHINGTGSSTVDTVFVCRSTGVMAKSTLASGPEEVAALVERDIQALILGRVSPKDGDIRSIALGHLTRQAVWHLRDTWLSDLPASGKLERVSAWITTFGGWPEVQQHLTPLEKEPLQSMAIGEDGAVYDEQISF